MFNINSKIVKNFLVGTAAVLLLAFLIHGCIKNNNLKDELSRVKLENQVIKTVANVNGQLVTMSQTEVTASKKALKEATDSIFNLSKKYEKKIKDVHAYYRQNSSVVIKEVEVPYIDTASVKHWEDSIKRQCAAVIDYYEDSTVKVPKTAEYVSDSLYAKLTATKYNITIDSLSIVDTQHIRLVTLKGGFLKKDQSGKRRLFLKKSFQVQVLHTNPLIKVTGQSSAIYISPKKPNWFGKALLIGGGIFIGTKL